jgi:cobalt-zinc-cadmium resistance protein CzcA
VYREDGRRYVPVKFSVRGRDLASTIADAQAAVERGVELPWESRVVWSGQLGELRRAEMRLALILPVTLILIVFIAYAAVNSAKEAAIVLANIPIAAAGGVLALWVTRTPLSVAAAMGFVSVLGVAVQDAILVVTAFQRNLASGLDAMGAAKAALQQRLRPVLMTSLVAMLGLMPAALSRGIGSDTQKPLAIFVIGGAAMLLIASRLMQSAVLVLVHRPRRAREPSGQSEPVSGPVQPLPEGPR